MRQSLRIACLAVALLAAGTVSARERLSGDLPVLMTADEISYDEELGTATARGGVEIIQGRRTLLADTVSYNQKTDTVSASGNIILHEPSGEVIFAEYVELSDQMKNGVIERIRVLLEDESRFAANSAVRRDGNKTTMRRAVFSPCKPCEEHPEAPPLWQLKAERVEHDQEDREIRYQDVFLEMWGMPVAYTPYLSHPDPTVDRKTGFLAPSFGTGGNVGGHIRLPYFITLGDDRDVTLEPIVTKDEGLVLSGEFRERFRRGELELTGSIAESDRNEGDPLNRTVQSDRVRGHFTAVGEYHFDETWRASLDLQRASDRTYLRKFDFFELNRNTLRSNLKVEGFRRRNYIAANGYWFQDLRTDATEEQPLALPVFDFNHIGESDRIGGRWALDANFRTIFRDEGTDSNRLSIKPGYQIARTWKPGLVTTATANVQADVYHIDRDTTTNSGESYAGRILPKLGIDMRYPFVRRGDAARQVIEPVALAILSPNGGNPEEIPDEESTAFEADDTNIFDLDRFPGLDRVESGSRVAYGMKYGLYGPRIGSITAFFGQSYRFHEDEELQTAKLLESDFSDYVGRIDVRPNEYIDMLYRFRFSTGDLATRASAVTFSVGPSAFQVAGDYFFLEEGVAAENPEKREELTIGFNTKINRYWSAGAFTRRDLTSTGGSLGHSMRVTYTDECFTVHTTAERTFTRDADLEPESRLLFQFIFKHLGQVTSNAG